MDKLNLKILDGLRSRVFGDECYRALVAILEEMATRPSSFEAVWHPVGFIHVNLGESNGAGLRLHLWTSIPEEHTGLGWPIHDHIWSLTSYVICGTIKNYLYDVQPNPSVPSHRIYAVKYDGRINYLEATEELISYAVATEETVPQGRIYRVEPGQFHSSEAVKNQLVATLVLAEKTETKSPRVVGALDGERVYVMERHRCADHVLAHEVSKVLQNLAHCRPA